MTPATKKQRLVPSPLPPSVLARILSYNVSTTNDVSKLRDISRSIGELAVPLLPSISPGSGHWIKCPTTRAFVQELVETCHTNEEGICCGDLYEEEEARWVNVFEGAVPNKLRFIGRYWELGNGPGTSKDQDTDMSEDELYSRMETICKQIDNVKSPDRLQELYEEACKLGLMEPINPLRSFPEEWDEDTPCYPIMLKLVVIPGAQSSIRVPGCDGLCWELESRVCTNIGAKVVPVHSGCRFRGVSAGENEVLVLLNVVISTEYKWDIMMEEEYNPTSLVYPYLWDKHQNLGLVEGVSIVDGAVSKSFQALLQGQIDALASRQESDKAIDYHPNSKDIVRDLIHPALYSYVKDISPLRASAEDVPPCIFPCMEGEATHQENGESKKDFWGRGYEESVYQWLPTYFTVSKDGCCTIEDYINNLTPREEPVHRALYHSLSKLFEQALPYIESVYSYVCAVRQELRDDETTIEYDDSGLEPLSVKCISLRGQKLQVITKIVDYEFQPGQEYEGAWHVEGMSHEEIVLTCLYILDRDPSIDGGEIVYKRTFLLDEAEYIFSSVPQDRPDALDHVIYQGLVPLGKVETRKGRLIVFPNSHVHKVEKMINKASEGIAKRRIVVFFLVNPFRRIVSTREVAPQQQHSGGTMTHGEALNHRLELMKERKFHKQDWNVREIELCEH